MVYQQCGPSCPQTCDTIADADCSGGCVEGCFCPSGQVFGNGNCIDEADCQGKLLFNYYSIPSIIEDCSSNNVMSMYSI